MANQRNGTLYVGITSDLIKRVYQHKNGVYKGFTHKYKVDKLVYYEVTTEIMDAIAREKQLKTWQRKWKLRLIEEMNPLWDDLYVTGCQPTLA